VNRIRVFLGINFPITTVRRLADEIAALGGPVAEAGWKVAWVPAANLHLTMKFLGSIAEASVEALRGRLGRELSASAPFEMELRGLGAFPSPAHPRILWAGVRAGAELAALHKDIEGWCEALGHPREERPFHAHVTIGRVKEGAPTGPLAPLIEARAEKVFGGGRAAEIVIYQSRLQRAGAEYVALARVPIGAGEPISRR
jgi:2'-5' RNA ligase